MTGDYAAVTYHTLLQRAVEALKRQDMFQECGHPEDLASNLIPAIEAVVAGFEWGVQFQREREARRVNSAFAAAPTSTTVEGLL